MPAPARQDRGDLPSHGAPGFPQSWLATGLRREFFARPAELVAPDLLGCVIAHRTGEGLVAVMLTEVEAYMGEADPASHAYRGRTARNAVMYGPPGHAYVYFTYGMHFCLNMVCCPEGEASAVLLRAGRVVDGVPLALARRRGTAALPRDEAADRAGAAGRRSRPRAEPRQLDLARGPARLCEALGIDRSQDGADVCGGDSRLRVFAAPAPVPATAVSQGPRVGVSRAADVAWRFWIARDPAVSAYRAHVPRRARAKPVTGPRSEGGTMPQ